MEDLYKVLNISENASSVQVKKAYYTLAKRYHPDNNSRKTNFFEEKFKKINTAYSVLSNPVERKKYDQQRQNVLNFKQVQNSHAQNLHTQKAPQTSSPLTPPPKSLTAAVELEISMEEAHNGCLKNIQFKRKVNDQEKLVKLSIQIPKGIQNDQKLLLKRQSHQFKSQKGDLIIKLKVQKHSLFQRKGDNLYIKLPLSITEAIFGKKMTLPTLTGQVFIDIKPQSQILRLKGQGFYTEDKITRGDLILEIKIDIPAQITEEDKVWFQNFKQREMPSKTLLEFQAKVQKLLLKKAS